VLEQMAQSDDPDVRQMAMEAYGYSEAFRATRNTLGTMPIMAAIPSPAGDKYRLVYDMRNSRQHFRLPGHLARREEQGPIQDEAVDEAYEFSGLTYDFYQEVFGRNSIDGQGMQLISSVHFSRRYNNAFWNGEQMVYGDGDGVRFVRFTKALDVVGHELTHGVVQHTSNLEYQDESGALNEHFADVMGELLQQWHHGYTVEQADWYMGGDIMAPSLEIKGLRTFKAEKAYDNHPIFGTDPQPKHMEDKYTGDEDNGGVHINSGIPNHSFYLAAMELGGRSWEKVGKIWYLTLLRLQRFSTFQEAAEVSCDAAAKLFGPSEASVVKMAWDKVGVTVS
jgi:Zn-dependent metalloprotease